MALAKDSTPKKEALPISKTRIFLIVLGLLIFMSIPIARLLWIQVLYPNDLIQKGNNRIIRTYHYEPPRGLITDRTGKILAISVPIVNVYADPKFLHEDGTYDNPKKMQKIADILGMNVNDLYKKTESLTKRFVNLKISLDGQKAKKISRITKKGIFWNNSYRRHYPTGESNAPLIGILNGKGEGIYGIEQSFNSFLSSTSRTVQVKQDNKGNIVENLGVLKQGTNGGNIVLSIDNRLQSFAYTSLANAVTENKAESGTAVLMDVKTGEILAMASYPSFDPNDRKHFNGENAQNRTISDIFEPGSTMKPLVALAALEAKATNWNEVFDTRPFIVDGKMVRDSHAMAQGTLSDIIKYSSNTGMAHISMRIGPMKIMNMIKRFGFGEKSTSGLVGESSGKLNSNRPFWADIDKATLGFGYGVAVTTLQLTSAYATLANGGLHQRVSILRQKKVPDPVLVTDSKQIRLMNQALETVVAGGTGGKAAIDRYRVAGKTGTAKIATVGGYGKDYMATFAGFAPISDPRFAMVVVMKAPKAGLIYGGAVSGPVFRDVMSRALQLYNVKPDREAVENNK